MKQKTIYQKPAIQQVMALTSGGFATSLMGNALKSTTASPEVSNDYSTSTGSWE